MPWPRTSTASGMANRRPRRPRKWLHPDGATRDYQRAMRRLAKSIREAVIASVYPVLASLREDEISDIPPSTGWYEELRQAFMNTLAMIEGQEEVGEEQEAIIAALAAGDLAQRFNKRQLQKILRSAYGVDFITREPWLEALMTRWEAENVKLIKSIPAQALDRMHGKVAEAVKRGTTVAGMRAELQAEFGITRRRAHLIARDQIEKLNADLTRHRQEEIGVTEYIWRGMMDERERPEHVEREGKRFSWDNPPWDGHPGQPIACRCYSEPVLPLLEDLNAIADPSAPEDMLQ